VILKMKDQRGKVYENKRPAFYKPQGDANVVENKGSVRRDKPAGSRG